MKSNKEQQEFTSVKKLLLLSTYILSFFFLTLCLFVHDSEALPGGSYQRSCQTNSCTDDGVTLGCNCRNTSGNYVLSPLDYSACESGSIWNQNGVLMCKPGSSFPGGSYKQTCGNCSDNSVTLTCSCKYNSNYSPSFLDYGTCESGSIWNEKSVLMCKPGASFPAGSYKQTCGNCTSDGSYLNCKCRYNGNYSSTNIYYGLCESEIWNQNGKLKCTPRGSFKRTCGPYTWDEDSITAACKTKKGKAYGSKLDDWKNCTGDIANCDGVLTCGGCN